MNDELYDFIHTVFSTSGSCSGYCEICNTSHPACDGERYENGICPDDCSGGNYDFYSIAHDWQDRQVGECCFEKIFESLKKVVDTYREDFLQYFFQRIEEEKKALEKEKNLLDKCA